jgi:hypothetical protein
MSELKRSQSLYSQRPPGARMPCRAPAAPEPLRAVSEPAELRVFESCEIAAVQGGDPYNGVGSRFAAAPPASRK